MLIGYMRVSKADGSQVLDLQRDALIAAGVVEDDIYEDMCSGSRDDRMGLAACLKALRRDDVLVVWKLDRLGRNLKHLLATVEDMTARGVGFKVLTGAPVDTTTPQGKLSFAMFAALAEFEARSYTGAHHCRFGCGAGTRKEGWAAPEDDRGEDQDGASRSCSP